MKGKPLEFLDDFDPFAGRPWLVEGMKEHLTGPG